MLLCSLSIRFAHRDPAISSIRDLTHGFSFSACLSYPKTPQHLTRYWSICILYWKAGGCLVGCLIGFLQIYWTIHFILKFIFSRCTLFWGSVFFWASGNQAFSIDLLSPPQRWGPCFPHTGNSWIALHPEWQRSLDPSFWSQSCLSSWGPEVLVWAPSRDFG